MKKGRRKKLYIFTALKLVLKTKSLLSLIYTHKLARLCKS
jgi:hypothetical protein